ncbi:hypothetical protein BASA60_000893 [Batrachochytrium salamandrivorans]|nr:hypothetical protein BASA62_008968 [Batrachochytrium salamandrivorans]KAH6584633.1 hypothetical protein BASA60_000893 [Batrachochytrium salamandrivorans]
MQYRSTRGQSDILSFEDAVLQGLAPDGGLYIPCSIPAVSAAELVQWRSLSFPALAAALFRKFISESEISDKDLSDITHKSFSTFADPTVVTPLSRLPSPTHDNLWVLELFHGPTFAFKDVALQFLGNLFDYFLRRKNASSHPNSKRHILTVVGATSGDTGGAAIYGLRGKPDIEVFILHPHKRISHVQELQMTSVLDANVHNIALKGSFDDCQDIVKALFSEESMRSQYSLAAINSINWARILAQTTYYFYSYFDLQRQLLQSASNAATLDVPVQFSVPTGNFGDIMAGFYAKAMGLPVERLIIATNENDILHRFLQTGEYVKAQNNTHTDGSSGLLDPVRQTLSPAMDILVSSNFERLMWYIVGADHLDLTCMNALSSNASLAHTASSLLAQLMDDLKTKGGFHVDVARLAAARAVFSSHRVDDDQISTAIQRYYHAGRRGPGHHASDKSYVLDPHTAVGVVAAEAILTMSSAAVSSSSSSSSSSSEATAMVAQSDGSSSVHTICLATASPGKFPDAVLGAINREAAFQPHLSFKDIAPAPLVALDGQPVRCVYVDTGLDGVRQIIRDTLSGI